MLRVLGGALGVLGGGLGVLGDPGGGNLWGSQ